MELKQNYMNKLVRENCYNFLDSPVIVTSGESITPFFLNGERVIGKNANDYKKFEMDPQGMYKWVTNQLKESEEFRTVMEYVEDNTHLSEIDFISGGRTRDWPFSAALAQMVGADALFLYKPQDNSNQIVQTFDGKVYSPQNLSGKNIFHIVDLVTTASSIVNKGGWIDQIQTLGGNIEEVYSIIDRNQGAEGILRKKGVELESAVKINESWLDEYDREHKNEVLGYLRNPQGWSIDYLLENGLDCILPHLDSSSNQAKKDQRILKFFEINREALEESGLLPNILMEITSSVRKGSLEEKLADKMLAKLVRNYEE